MADSVEQLYKEQANTNKMYPVLAPNTTKDDVVVFGSNGEGLDSGKKLTDIQNYNNLSNKPSINGNALTGNKTANALGLQNTVSNPTADNLLATNSSGQAIDSGINKDKVQDLVDGQAEAYVDTDTLIDQKFLSRRNAKDYNGKGKIKRIKGNSIVWNQLIKNGNFASTSGWGGRLSSISVSSNIASITPTSDGTQRGIQSQASGQETLNHIYYAAIDIKSPINGAFELSFAGGAPRINITASQDQWVHASGTMQNTTTTIRNLSLYVLCNSTLTTSQTVEFKNAKVFDLTQMFGYGNEPSLNEFETLLERYFPSNYYEYNVGTLLSFIGTSLNGLSLPNNTYFSTGMKSAGSIYDELTETQAITRIGRVDLGTLNWYKTTTNNMPRFYSDYLDLSKPPADGVTKPNIICSKYTTVLFSEISTTPVDKTISQNIGTNKSISIVDTTYTNNTVAEFKAAMSGVYLYYELATPTTQTVNLDLEYTITENGYEKVLPENGATPTTTPIIADIAYSKLAKFGPYFYIDEKGYGCINYDLFE